MLKLEKCENLSRKHRTKMTDMKKTGIVYILVNKMTARIPIINNHKFATITSNCVKQTIHNTIEL